MDLRKIAAVFFALILVAFTSVYLNSEENGRSAPRDCLTVYNLSKMAANSYFIIVNADVYDISNWSNKSFTLGQALLYKHLTPEELKALGEPVGSLCVESMESVSYSARIGFSPGTRQFTAAVLNNTVDEFMEVSKRTPNSGDYLGWHLKTNASLLEVHDICQDDFDLAILAEKPDIEYANSCGLKIFKTGGNDTVYIARKADDNDFISRFTLVLMEEPGCALVERCT